MNVEAARAQEAAQERRIAIIGLPNTGKSLIFGHLTGDYAIVANYPFTTVEIKRRDCCMNGSPCQVIDTPGLHCLSTHSAEELAIRNLVIYERPGLILQCIDANQLKQSLLLTADLLELGVPMVVSLNAIDETSRKGMWIDSDTLSQLLGVPVIETIATRGYGINQLRKALAHAKAPPCPIRYGEAIENAVSDLQGLLGDGIPHARKIALLMCMGDPFIERLMAGFVGRDQLGQSKARVRRLVLQLRGDAAATILSVRNRWVDEVAQRITKEQKVRTPQLSMSFGHLCRHPIFGIPIALFFLMATYCLVVHVAGTLEGVLNDFVVDPVVLFISNALPAGFWNELVVGKDYGFLTLGLFNAVCTVLPILSVFFLMFGVLEDVGYIPNLCVLTKRIFEKVGLTGKAVLSLVLGFGCKTMATLTTAGLPRKEKLIAVYLIAFSIPCSAQMGLSMGLLGRYAFWALLVTFGALVVVELLAGLVLKRIIPDEDTSNFIQELPPIRLPNLRAVAIKTYYRLYWFLKEAVPIFIIAALGLFLVDKIGVLDAVKVACEPIIVNWLGMPLGVVDALILCLARHEAATGLLIHMADAGQLDVVQCLVAVFLTVMFVPCFANIVSMCKMVGVRTGLLMTAAINGSAFLLAGIFYWVLVLFREALV